MRLQSLSVMIFTATLILNLVMGVYFATGVIQTPGGNNNIAGSDSAMQLMIDPNTSGASNGNTLDAIWSAVTGYGYGAMNFMVKMVWLKGDLDQFLPEGPNQYPFNVFIDMFQTLIGTVYGIFIWGLITNRPTG